MKIANFNSKFTAMPNTPTPPEQPEQPEPKKYKRRKKQERHFAGNDADYIQHSRVKLKHFAENMPQFTGFDTQFSPIFLAQWQSQIEQCEALPNHETTQDELTQHAFLRNDALTILLEKIKTIEYYAQKAYKDEPEALYELGFHKIKRPDQYTLDFIIHCLAIHQLAEEDYNAELLAAGMPPAAITELETAITEVARHEINHEKFKIIIMRRTRLRIKAMNQLHAINETVKSAAAVIFINNEATRGLFA
jgi:hypothetical protein